MSANSANLARQGFERRWYTKAMDRYRRSSVYLPLLNEAVRTGLRLKYFRDRRRVAGHCRGRESEIRDWFGGLELFFVLSSFRSGTVFLTNLLKLELDDAQVEHEANVLDYWTMPKARQDEKAAEDYISRYRRNEIFTRAPRDIRTYGEINPFLRCHVRALQKAFPSARFLHVVRDPRDVVRSIMGRENYSRKDPLAALMVPSATDSYSADWPRMSRIERVCWEWQHDNRYLRKHIPQHVRFEDFTTRYSAFKEGILDRLDLHVSEASWERYVTQPRNASKKHRIPHWSAWPEKDLRALQRICGEEMRHYGYSIT